MADVNVVVGGISYVGWCWCVVGVVLVCCWGGVGVLLGWCIVFMLMCSSVLVFVVFVLASDPGVVLVLCFISM